MMSEVSLAPSILSADFSKLKEEVEEVEEAADYIHVDVMDGHFVPNITIGPLVSNSLKNVESIETPLSIHLMITDPEQYAPDFEVDSEDLIIFHSEVTDNTKKTIERLQELGCQVGISQKPGSDRQEVIPFLEELDEVLVMGVEPGFGGQDFMSQALDRIEVLRQEIERKDTQTALAVDGGMNESTIGKAVKAGADTIIAGSAVFGEEDRIQAIDDLKGAV
ncbi:ribulose-phosphate 3-epimerase [Candidatus Bipolaricaulota bacterium]|nr:ribulose-phosphate 3-epimerase [Candidatus Bipolaricaulota bacterium]